MYYYCVSVIAVCMQITLINALNISNYFFLLWRLDFSTIVMFHSYHNGLTHIFQNKNVLVSIIHDYYLNKNKTEILQEQ